MIDKTFRQTVEEILSSTECEDDGRICSDMTLDKYEERPSCEQCRTDRICSAVLKMAEGMPDAVDAEVDYLAGYTDCRDECQAYLRKQVE